MADFKSRFKAAAKARANGCPLFEGRDKGEWDDIEGETVTLQRAYPLSGDNGTYYAVWFEEEPDLFFLSPSLLTSIIVPAEQIAADEGVTLDEVIAGLQIKVGPEKKANNGHKFRSMEVIG